MSNPLSPNTRDNEQNKFKNDSNNEVAVNVVGETKNLVTNPDGEVVDLKGFGYLDSMSTSTPLLSEESFVTPITYIGDYQTLRTEIATDVDGTLIGTWYDDELGTNEIRKFTLPYSAINGLSLTGTDILGKYLRYEFVNTSDSDQTYLVFNVKLSQDTYSGQLLRVNQFVPENVLAQLTRSVLVGLNSKGIYTNIRANDVGALNTTDFVLEVSRGTYPTYSNNTKFGRASDVDTGTVPETVWNGGGLYTGYPDIDDLVEVFSADANDTVSGTGARIVELIGLNSQYEQQTEYIRLNGTSPTISVKRYLRLSRVKVIYAGSNETNIGELTVRQVNNPATVFAVMPVGGQTAICADTVPANKTRYILQLSCEINRLTGAAGSANARLRIRPQGGAWRAIRNVDVSTSSPYIENLSGAIKIEEKTDIEWTINEASDNNTSSSARFEYIDIDNTDPLNNILSLKFDASKSQYIDFGYNENLNLSNNFTISTWFKTANTATQTIISKYGALATQRAYFIEKASQGKIRVYLYGAGGIVKDYTTVDGNFDDNSWHQVTISFDNSRGFDALKIFIDGIRKDVVKTVDANITTLQSSTSLTSLGALTLNPAINYFTGNIDSTSIFSRALTDAEKVELYNEGKVYDISQASFKDDCLTWWRLGESPNFPLISDYCDESVGIGINFTGEEISEDIP